MLLRRYGTFSGGIDLPDQKSATLDRPTEPAPLPSRLLVPLALCGRAPARPIVRPGDRVSEGQRIAEAADETAVDVFAPLAGRVVSVEAVAQVAAAEGFVPSLAIELADLDDRSPPAAHEPVGDWAGAEPPDLADWLRSGGLTTFRRPAEPLAAWVHRARERQCDVLIANAVEGQPYVTSDHRLLVEHGPEVVAGLAILGRIIAPRWLMLAVDYRRTDRYRGLARAAGRHGIANIALPHKYPIGADAMLTKVLTRRTCAPGATAMDVGVAVTDAATCLAVFQWITCGIRPTRRVVTVAGERARFARNYWALLGSPCRELIGCDGPVIHGGPMVGLRCAEHAVVCPATDALLAIHEAPMISPTPCIRCGWCTDHCPARLNVAVLNDDFELSLVDHARRLGVAACVECGVCGYVCPARLPLSDRIRQLKRAAGRPAVGAVSTPGGVA